MNTMRLSSLFGIVARTPIGICPKWYSNTSVKPGGGGGGEVGGSNERCLLTSNFDAKTIHGVKQNGLLIAIF